jgi:SAM-dependent methyltransferase
MICRFWNYISTNPRFQPLYFSKMVGRGIAHFLQLTGSLQGSFLDYGCGPGHLLREVCGLDLPLDCWGVDSSPASVALVNQQLATEPHWQGAALLESTRAPFPDCFFDIVACIETIEHLSDEVLAGLLEDIGRILRPGGIALFSTPHEEDLEVTMVYCPFCDAEFHGMQHFRSFSVGSLRALLISAGFRVLFCRDLDFAEFQRPYPGRGRAGGLRGWRTFLGDLVRRWQDRRSPRPFPEGREFNRLLVPGRHLCAVAQLA